MFIYKAMVVVMRGGWTYHSQYVALEKGEGVKRWRGITVLVKMDGRRIIRCSLLIYDLANSSLLAQYTPNSAPITATDQSHNTFYWNERHM